MSSNQLESIGLIYSKADKQSFTYLLKHKKTNKYVATVRLFFINNDTLIQQLPIQNSYDIEDINSLTINLPVVEVSRGALIQHLPPHKNYSALKVRTMLTYGLMVATRINFFLYSYKTIFTFIERPLYLIFQRQNVVFKQISNSITSHGKIKNSYAINRQQLLQDTESIMGKLTRHYLKELCQNPDSFWEFIDNNPYLERSDIQLDRICKLFNEHGDNVDLSLLLGDEENIEIPMV